MARQTTQHNTIQRNTTQQDDNKKATQDREGRRALPAFLISTKSRNVFSFFNAKSILVEPGKDRTKF